MNIKKWILTLVFMAIMVSAIGCSSSSSAKSQDGTYLESVDEYNKFSVMKLVDKDSGCKFLVTREFNRSQMTVTQIYNSSGNPICD